MDCNLLINHLKINSHFSPPYLLLYEVQFYNVCSQCLPSVEYKYLLRHILVCQWQ